MEETKTKEKSPKDIYFDQLSETTDTELVRGMTHLYEWGSGDFKLNHALLKRYNNDIVKSIAVLSGDFPSTLKEVLKEVH